MRFFPFAGAALLGSLTILGVVSQPVHATPSCLGFDSNGATGVMTCEVPPGVTALRVVAEGAGGGGAGGGANIASGAGGDGAKVTYDLPVTPGDTLTLEVGTGGASAGSNQDGAGGGGWTAVKNGATLLLVAAGGGGAGSDGNNFVTGVVVDGGDASDGGTSAGGDGASNEPSLNAGEGASASAGGLGGACTSGCAGPMYNGADGASSLGGSGADQLGGNGAGQAGSGWQGGAAGSSSMFGTGGGGGSGYFGGGGGSARWFSLGAGGGAGSSYPATGATYETAGNGGAVNTAGGDGSIVLTAAPAPAAPAMPVLPPELPALVNQPAVTVPASTVAPSTSLAPSTTIMPTTTVPSTTTVPAPVPVDGGVLPELEPGMSQVLENGVATPVELFVQDSTELVLRGQGFRLGLAGECSYGCTIGTDVNGREVLELEQNGRGNVQGEGFLAGTPVYVWLFSEPSFLGELTVQADGTFAGSVSLEGIEVGEHTLQVNGTSFDGKDRTANLGVVVSPQGVPTPLPGVLPSTGTDIDLSVWVMLLTALGGALVWTTRRTAPVRSRH